MKKLNPEKLSVEYRQGITQTFPIISRRYTLTHSDITSELFLTLGVGFAYDKINQMRDEVLGEWVKIRNNFYYYVYLHVDGQQLDLNTALFRNQIFKRELPLALEAIRYGDREFFQAHPYLYSAPIIVFFMSNFPQINRIETWGNFADY